MPAKPTLLITGILCGLIVGSSTLAQEPLINRIVRGNWIRCSVVGGRISVEGIRVGANRFNVNAPQRKESLNIRNENGQLSLSYEQTTKTEQTTIEIATANSRILLRRTPRDNSDVVPVEFSQTDNKPLSLTIGAGDSQRVFSSPSLWHLLTVQPQECRQCLLPLFEMLRPGWKLAETTAAVEAKLAQGAGTIAASDRTHWAALVKQLTDESFAKREAADRALRTGDVNAIAYLRQLDFNRLDAEQQFRVRRILEAAVEQIGEDSVEQIAASLTSDPTVWLALLSRPELATRQAAARQLASLLGEPVEIDPAADPDTQQDKREQLRAQIPDNKSDHP